MRKITPIDSLKMKKFCNQQADRPLLWDEQTNNEASNSLEDLVQREETVWSSCRSSCGISNLWIPRNANNSNKCNNTSAQLPIQNNATKRDAIHRDANSKRRRRRSTNLFEKRNGNCDDDDFNSSFPSLPLRTPPRPPPTHISTVSFPTAINPSRWCLNLAVHIMLLLWILPEKRDIIFYLANFRTFFRNF